MRTMDDVVAIAEDEPLCWVKRHATRHEARQLAREVIGGDTLPLSRFRVTAQHMRPAKCEVHPDGRPLDDEDVDRDYENGCECFYVEEGWHFTCEKDHPAAFPVWRVEDTAA